MVELISRVWIHNSVRHHTELFEKSNKIKERKTHSKPATKVWKTFAISILWRMGREIFLGKKTFCVSFCKPLFNLSSKMTTKTKLWDDLFFSFNNCALRNTDWWHGGTVKVHLTPKYFFRLNKSLHLFETHCAFLN